MKCNLCALADSFRYAISGICRCVRSERNFRIHLVAAAYVLLLAVFLDLDGFRMAVLFLTISNVLVMEMLNTAIETLVDLASPGQHPLAKIAKDVAAGAVLVSALFGAAVGIALLWQPDKLLLLAENLLTSPYLFVAAACSIALAALFIFGMDQKKES